MRQIVDADGNVGCLLCNMTVRYMSESTYAAITIGKRRREIEDTEFVDDGSGTGRKTPIKVIRTIQYPNVLTGEFCGVCVAEWRRKTTLVLDHYDKVNNVKHYRTVCAVVVKDRPGAAPAGMSTRHTTRLWNEHSASGDRRHRDRLDW